jgi:hypothetical protein
VRGAKAFGALGDDNGVTVVFANVLSGDRGGKVERGAGGVGIEVDPKNPTRIRAALVVKMKTGQTGMTLEETVAHEGSHVADYQDYVASIGSTGGDPALNITKRETEVRAYHISVGYALRGNESLNLGHCGKDPCKFRPGMMGKLKDDMINQLLDDPQNGYTNLEKKLFPEYP